LTSRKPVHWRLTAKQELLGARIWAEEINAKGGLLDRKVELIGYDDQSNPSNVPGIYAKLLDVDKVDLIMGPYGTKLVAPAIPVAMQKGKVMIGLFALEANSHFHYANYFSMVPYGPNPKVSSGEGFFAVAAEQTPKPQDRDAVGRPYRLIPTPRLLERCCRGLEGLWL
jgi:branched-chain amino acid transport system substrate-binding protein